MPKVHSAAEAMTDAEPFRDRAPLSPPPDGRDRVGSLFDDYDLDSRWH